jgi:hypothetical protein
VRLCAHLGGPWRACVCVSTLMSNLYLHVYGRVGGAFTALIERGWGRRLLDGHGMQGARKPPLQADLTPFPLPLHLAVCPRSWHALCSPPCASRRCCWGAALALSLTGSWLPWWLRGACCPAVCCCPGCTPAPMRPRGPGTCLGGPRLQSTALHGARGASSRVVGPPRPGHAGRAARPVKQLRPWVAPSSFGTRRRRHPQARPPRWTCHQLRWRPLPTDACASRMPSWWVVGTMGVISYM